MLSKVILKPDRNRPKLRSELARKLQAGIIVDSLSSLNHFLWTNGQKPRVMLIVPPYTRINRPLEVIAQNIERNVHNPKYLKEDMDIIQNLKIEGIMYLEGMKRAGLPMGLLRIGTAAKERGYDIKIVDGVFEGWHNEEKSFETSEGNTMIRYGLSNDDIAKKIRNFNPHVVGITCSYTHQWGNARELADLVKCIDPEIITIMGGVHVNGLPNDVLLDSPTDYAVLRQADETFPELLDVLTKKPRSKGSLSDVKGIMFRKQGEVQKTTPRMFIKDINDIAIPDLSLLDLDLYGSTYHSAGKRKRDDGNLIYGFTSFGCNTGCRFCAIPSSQGGFKKMNRKYIRKYFEYISKQGVTEFLVEDDHLFHDPDYARDVFSELKKNNLSWFEEGGCSLFSMIGLLPNIDRTYLDRNATNRHIFKNIITAREDGLTTEQLINEMADSGCYGVYLAVESANVDSLEASHKPRLNTEEQHTAEVVRLFNKYGISTTCGTMLGFVDYNRKEFVESRDQIKRTIAYGKFLRGHAGASYINPFIVTPLPGAPNFHSLEHHLGERLCRNTDEGYSHEFGTVDAPDGEWIRDEMSLLRIHSILKSNGIKEYKDMLKTGTWPVGK